MKKVIIGIHGLGNKPRKDLLENWWETAMYEGLYYRNDPKNLPVFEMVYWADVLYNEPLNEKVTDQNNPLYIDEPYTPRPKNYLVEHHTFRQKIIDFVTSQVNKIFLNKDKTLNYSYITDYIVKKYFKDLEIYYNEECDDENNIRCKARDVIRNRVVEILKKYKNYKIMLVAHSMGSIVAYDVLNFLVPEIKIHTLVTIGSPLGMPVVISKIAAEQRKYSNKPFDMHTPPGVTHNWFNFADIMDNIALHYKLAKSYTVNDLGIGPTDYLVNNYYESNGVKNPHKSFGYLRTPVFADILSEFIGEVKVGDKLRLKLQKLIALIKQQHSKFKDRLKQE